MTATTDEMDDVVTFFQGKWTSANTDGKTPTIAKIIDYMEPNCEQIDWVLMHQPRENRKPAGLGGARGNTLNVSADIRVGAAYGSTPALRRTHAKKVLAELKRILNANINLSGDTTLGPSGQGFHSIDENYDVQDLSDKLRQMHRFVVDFRFLIRNA